MAIPDQPWKQIRVVQLGVWFIHLLPLSNINVCCFNLFDIGKSKKCKLPCVNHRVEEL